MVDEYLMILHCGHLHIERKLGLTNMTICELDNNEVSRQYNKCSEMPILLLVGAIVIVGYCLLHCPVPELNHKKLWLVTMIIALRGSSFLAIN